jgi:hypothetical protein
VQSRSRYNLDNAQVDTRPASKLRKSRRIFFILGFIAKPKGPRIELAFPL